jgi:uncharacterized membrane protein YqhA
MATKIDDSAVPQVTQAPETRSSASTLQRTLAATRYWILLAVVCIFVGATTMLLYGAYDTYLVIAGLLTNGAGTGKGAKQLVLDFIEIVDVFLISTVMYVIAVGLYELFIDDRVPVPAWLEIHDLDDLKQKLLSVVIAVLSVLFLGQVVSWDGQTDLQGFGIAIAVVVAALTYFLSQKSKKKTGKETE